MIFLQLNDSLLTTLLLQVRLVLTLTKHELICANLVGAGLSFLVNIIQLLSGLADFTVACLALLGTLPHLRAQFTTLIFKSFHERLNLIQFKFIDVVSDTIMICAAHRMSMHRSSVGFY